MPAFVRNFQESAGVNDSLRLIVSLIVEQISKQTDITNQLPFSNKFWQNYKQKANKGIIVKQSLMRNTIYFLSLNHLIISIIFFISHFDSSSLPLLVYAKELVFSREPTIRLTLSDSDQISSTQSTEEYLYCCINKQGIWVYDWTKKEKISQLVIQNEANPSIFIPNQKNTKLFVVTGSKILCYDIIHQQVNGILTLSINQVLSVNQEVSAQVSKMIIDQNDSLLFLYGGNQVAIFDANTLLKLDLIDLGELVVQMRLSFDGNYLFLLSRNANSNNIRVFLITQSKVFKEIGKSNFDPTLHDFEVSIDRMWIYGVDKRNQILKIASISSIYADSNQINIIQSWKQFWPFNINSPIVFSVKVTINNEYLLIGIRSVGILILDINDKINPKWYYLISFSEIPLFFEFNGNLQDQIAVSDSSSIMFFKGQLLNLNQSIPNLFNIHQAQIISMPVPRRCISMNNGKNLLVSQQISGLTLLKFYDGDSPNLVKSSAKIQLSSYWDIVYDIPTKTVYTTPPPSSAYVLDFLQLDYGDSTNNPKITLISEIPNKNASQGQSNFLNVQRSKDNKLIIQSYGNGFILYDSSDYPNLKQIVMVNIMPTTVHQADITKNNKWVICSQRITGNYGIIDISDFQNISLKNIWRTSGVEGVVTSSIGDYAYLYDGSKGITIIDTSVLPQIKVLSNIKTNGWASYISLFSNEEYLITSTLSSDLVILIDIRDKTKPFIVSKFSENQEKGYATCLSPDEGTLFILNSIGVRSLPIKTKTQIHFQQNIYDKTSQTYSEIDNKSNLKIGNTYVILLTPLYATDGQRIHEVLYYNNYVQESLPSWIQFSYSSNSLVIQASKEGLGIFSGSPPLSRQNMVLIKVQRKILSTDFIFDPLLTGIQTSSSQSSEIFQQLKQQGIIVKENFLPQTFFDDVSLLSINISGFTVDQLILLSDLVRRRLKESLEVIPLMFVIEQSFQLDFSSSDNKIQSLSTSAIVKFSVTEGSGSFVRKNYKGVITSSNESLSELKLEGSIQSLNQVLFEKIIFYANKDLGQIQLNILIDDNVNYQQSMDIVLNDSRNSFIQLKTPVTLQKPLQEQLESIYPNGILYIESSTNIEFDVNTFQVSDPFFIEYKIYILFDQDSDIQNDIDPNNNLEIHQQFQLGFRPLPDNHWLKFDNIKLKLSGYSTKKFYNTRYTFKIIASDGFTKAEDTFDVVLSGLPLSFIIILVFQILGPLFSLIGIYKYRSCIYNYLYHKKVGSLYQEQISINTLYVKKIAIIGDELIKAQKLLESIIALMRNNKEQIFSLGQRSSSSLSQSGIQEDIANTRKTINEKNIYFKNQLFQNAISNSGNLDELKPLNEKQRQIIVQNFISSASNQLEVDITYKKQLQMEESKRLSQVQINNSIVKSRKLSLWLIQKKIISFFTDTTLRTISIEKTWLFLQKHKVCYLFNEQTITPQHYGIYLQDPTSVFYYCFIACLSEFLLKMDNITYLAYTSLQQLMSDHYKKEKKQWYDRYVKATIQYSTNYEISTSPFPEIEFNEKLFRADIESFFKEEIPNFDQEKLSQLKPQILQNLNIGIIKEAIISQKLGILRQEAGIFHKQFTEYSLHAKPFLIDSIQCLKEEHSQNCMKLRRCLHMNKQNYILQKNTNFLPNWMKLDIRNANCVILYGVPSFYEQEEILVRIYDKQQFIICQFDLKIYTPKYQDNDASLPKLKLFNNYSFSQSRVKQSNSCYSPLNIRSNQIQLLEEQKKIHITRESTTEENLLQHSQQLIHRSKTAFQRLQNKCLTSERENDDIKDDKRNTIYLNTIFNSSEEVDEDNCSSLKEEDYPIEMYASQEKKTKISDFVIMN